VADAMDGFGFDCPCCGQRHTGLPALVCPRPDAFWALPEDQQQCADANDDFCVITENAFFVRATLRISIIDEEAFSLEYGIWGSLSKANFLRYRDTFFDTDQSKLGGMFSYLSNALPGYGPFHQALRGTLFPKDHRQRPLFVLNEEQEHALVRDQVHGVSKARAIELALPVLHPQGEA
jgi:hypothetical protein